MRNLLYSTFLWVVALLSVEAQTINLNQNQLQRDFRIAQLMGNLGSDISFTSRPLDVGKNGISVNPDFFNLEEYEYTLFSKWDGDLKISVLPLDVTTTFTSHHPYNRNNGSLIPAKGLQTRISAGLFAEIGPLSIQFKPEYVTAGNDDFEGFWEGHYPVIWARRYNAWNRYDLPEQFGYENYTKTFLGQSSIRLNWKGMSLGVSSENIWWGPSIRNSIMMSNQAPGFNHITFNSTKPIQTPIGAFEWQLVTGQLEGSGFTPPQPERTYAGTRLYVPKNDDSRYFQGFTLTYSPKYIEGLSIGFIRWVQTYSEFVEENNDYFPAFDNLFRNNDKYENRNGSLELERDQAAGIFMRWLWKDAKAEIYGEFHHNDSKANFRDLLLDSDHSRAATIGLQKVFSSPRDDINYMFSWEWTQLEQSSSRLLRNAGSWYMHGNVRHGYTHRGEVLGAGIGPGSNSHYFAVTALRPNIRYAAALEIIDVDNDWFIAAFDEAKDFRRYWKDYNIHLSAEKKFNTIWASFNMVYSRSMNYQWELDDFAEPYYHPGRDVDNFHFDISLTYSFAKKKKQ